MKEIPFNLERAKAGEPILLNGKPARFIAHVPDAITHDRVIVLSEDKELHSFAESGIGSVRRITMAPKKCVFWVNVYTRGNGLEIGESNGSKEAADRYCNPARVACLRIEFTEGEGLDEVKP